VVHAELARQAESVETVNALKCGCEVREGRLLTVCAMHANYTRQHVEKARAPREGVDKDLQRQLVVAIAPIVVSKVDLSAWRSETVAEEIHNQVHEIMRRMD
jgi:hypothetical protein